MDLAKLFKDAWRLFTKDIGQLIVGLLLAGVIAGALAAAVLMPAVLIALPGLSSASESGQATGLSVVAVVAFVAGYVAAIVVIVLVAIPLYAGVLIGALRRVREGRRMGYWDLFDGFHVFGRVVAAYLLAYFLIPAVVVALPSVIIALGAVSRSTPVVAVGVVVAALATLVLVYLVVCWTYVIVVVLDRGVPATEALRESRALVHGTGWWWTFLAVFLLQLAVMVASLAAGFIPFVGMAVGVFTAPFSLTYLLAMYFQARREDWMIDAAVAAPDAQQQVR